MIYALTSQGISEDDRLEIDLALKTLKQHEDAGRIVHVLDPQENMFCIYCRTEVFSRSKTSRNGKQMMYFQHKQTPDPACLGSDHYLGTENHQSHVLRVNRLWEMLKPPKGSD